IAQQSGWLHGSAMKSSGPIRPAVCSPSRRNVPVVVTRSSGSIGAARPDPKTGWEATPAIVSAAQGDSAAAPAADVIGGAGEVRDRADLVVVDAARDRHRQRGKDALAGQATNGLFFDR